MNILLPTDFSENSLNAAAYSLQLFKDIPCHFHLLHVLTIPSMTAGVSDTVLPEDIQVKFEKLLSQLNLVKRNPEHYFHTSYKINFLIEAVRQQVLEKNIDLILMGTKGATNKKGSIVGRNTSDVMMKVKCPVMAISENAVFKGHKEILFPTDYKIHYSEKMLKTLLILTNLSKASVKILELFNSEVEPSEEQLTNKFFLQNSFVNNKPEFQTYYSAKNSDASPIFQSNLNAEMIVMAAKNLNLCQKLLRDNPQNQIPFINQLPLLVLHG